MHLRKKVHSNVIKFLLNSLPKIDIQNTSKMMFEKSHFLILKSPPSVTWEVLQENQNAIKK